MYIRVVKHKTPIEVLQDELQEVSVEQEASPSSNEIHDSYLIEVPEGLLVDEILRLRTGAMGGGDKYSRICRFKVDTPGVPFRVDSDGKTCTILVY